MSGILRRAAWWARDYMYAGAWQTRAFFDRSDPHGFSSGVLTPILVLPGVYETWRFLQPLVAELHRRGHPVHVVDSLRRNRRPFGDEAVEVLAHIDRLGLRDIVLVAHSKGGLVGKQTMVLDQEDRIRGMVAVATPFGGSRYADFMLLPTLRAFSPRHRAIMDLAAHADANARIVSVFGEFDPHIPAGSELPGARNVRLDTGGHFRILAHPRVIAEVVALADGTPA